MDENMANAKNSITFGRYLKAIRLEKGIDLETIAHETKIGIDILQRIESEDHARLPSEVFVKGFLRAYAKLLGADAKEVVQRYVSQHRLRRNYVRLASDPPESSKAFWSRLGLILLMLLGVMIVSIFLTSHF